MSYTVAVIMLSARQISFVREYLVDFNGTRAAIRAGIPEGGASTEAYRLLSNAEVVAAINDRQTELAAAAGLSIEWVLRQWKEIAEADPAELIYLEVECCRHCHGVNHEYQWTEFEYRKAVEVVRSHACNSRCEEPCVKRVPPLPTGGMGFDPHLAPEPHCPVCHGRGVDRVIVADTRKLKGAAKRLYAGIRQMQHGVEVKMRNQDEAVDKIAKFLGMLIDKRELSGPNGQPVTIASFDAKDLTDEQLLQVIRNGN